MAGRYPKLGLDYYPKTTNYHREEPILLLRGAHGWKGYVTILALHDYIFGNRGYYIEWTEQEQERFMAWSQLYPFVQRPALAEIVKSCFKYGLFDKRAFETCNILTSTDIQHTWLIATRKRTKRYVVRDYWIYSAVGAEEMQFMAEEIRQTKGNKILFINKSDIGVVEEAIRDHEVEDKVLRRNNAEGGSNTCSKNTSDYEISYINFLQRKRYEGQRFMDMIRRCSDRFRNASNARIEELLSTFCNRENELKTKHDTEGALLAHFIYWLEKQRSGNEKTTKPTTVAPRADKQSSRPSIYGKDDFEDKGEL